MSIDTLNPEAPTTSTATPVAEPSPASPSVGEPCRSNKTQGDPFRCPYLYPNGRRCTLPGLPALAGLCLRHYNRQVAAGFPLMPSPSDSEDLSADLLPDLSEFSSGDHILEFLSRLLVLVTKGRVGPRRAAVLTNISNQLLHSHRAIEKDAASHPQQIIFDLPRPKRD